MLSFHTTIQTIPIIIDRNTLATPEAHHLLLNGYFSFLTGHWLNWHIDLQEFLTLKP